MVKMTTNVKTELYFIILTNSLEQTIYKLKKNKQKQSFKQRIHQMLKSEKKHKLNRQIDRTIYILRFHFLLI